MQIQRVLAVLTVLNLGCSSSAGANASGGGEERRLGAAGSALEIVDNQGRVRASIKLHPEDRAYPETVMFRLIDQNGRPEVKLGASVDVAARIGRDNDATQILLKAEGSESHLKLKHPSGRST